MPRRLRIHVPGGVYHVTLRGNHRQPIFFADSDRSLFNIIVARALEKFATRLHAYCWMTNHVHLVLQAGRDPISRPMHDIAAEFARAMQLKLETSGHFFERRYHAALVDTDSYMLQLLRYVHLNPVTAGIAASVDDYRWTSHHNYRGARHDAWRRCAMPTSREFARGSHTRRANAVSQRSPQWPGRSAARKARCATPSVHIRKKWSDEA